MLDAQAKVADLRKFLDQIYNHDLKLGEQRVNLGEFSDDELLRLAGNLTDGVPMATPVFDGATEAEIKHDARRSPTCRPAARPSCTTAAPARRSIARSPSATCTC